MMEKKIIGALPIGATLQDGTYTIDSVLGQGATGITYLASMQQRLTGNLSEFSEKVQVAIKEFYFKEECRREGTTQNVVIANTNYDAKVAQFKKSFIKEAKRIAGLSHPNIVHVLGIFEENNTVYYVMQYIRGGSLKDYIDAHGAVPSYKAVKYALQVASALDYMHKKNMCHYDLKPGNIMLSSDDNAMLIDFGIAKNYDNSGQETSTTPPGLTKGYAPLEQYTSVTEFSPLIDVYSLGATLYAMLTGHTPPEPMKWIGGNFTECPAGVSASLWNIVRTAMAVASKDRPTMEQLHQLLLAPDEPVAMAGEEETVYGEDLKEDVPNNSETIYDNTVGQQQSHNQVSVDAPQEISIASMEDEEPKSNKLFYVLLVVIALLACIGGYWLMSGRSAESTASDDGQDTLQVTTIYDSHGQPIMTFSGTVSHGQPQGNGVLTYLTDNVKDRYEGVIKDGLREDSTAVLFFKNGDVFRGAFEKDHFTIGAYYVKESGEYFQGKFKNDQPWNGVWYDAQHNVISRVDNGVEK